jgi:hypothetical protein
MNIFQALAHIANDDPEIIKKINTWLTVQNDNYKIPKPFDFQVITACINTLGAIGDPSSFPPLLLVPFTGYPDAVKKASEAALYALKGKLKDMYINMINISRFNEKRYTLDKALAETKMDNAEKCEVAFAALKIAVNTVIEIPDERDISRDIRDKAILFLGDNGYSAAAEFGIAHFKRSLEEYESKRMPSTGLLAVIKALGQLKSHEAAVELKNYLDNINSLFEDGKPYEEQVVLQVISSLGMLGDKFARSSLLYVGYLRYSDKIKKAADAAFNAIK